MDEGKDKYKMPPQFNWEPYDLWDNFYRWSKFSQEKPKSELKTILESIKTHDIVYSILWNKTKKDIKKLFGNAKRKVFFRNVKKQIPVLRDKIIDGKKIDEFGPVLPVLEEKQVNNPDDKNVKVHNIQINTKVINQESIYVQEALPPEPLKFVIYVPYALYVLSFIEQEDTLFDTNKYFQHIKLLLDSIWEIEKHIWEKMQIKIVCENDGGIDESKKLSEQEKKERAQAIFNWINKHYDRHDVSLILNNTWEKESWKKGAMELARHWNYSYIDIFDENMWREYNVLTNILGKDKRYFSTMSKSSNIEIWWDIEISNFTILSVTKKYLSKMFDFIW